MSGYWSITNRCAAALLFWLLPISAFAQQQPFTIPPFNCPAGQYITGYNPNTFGMPPFKCSTPPGLPTSPGQPAGGVQFNQNGSFNGTNVLGNSVVVTPPTGSPPSESTLLPPGVTLQGPVPTIGIPSGTQVSCLGLDSSGNLVSSSGACGTGGGGSATLLVGGDSSSCLLVGGDSSSCLLVGGS